MGEMRTPQDAARSWRVVSASSIHEYPARGQREAGVADPSGQLQEKGVDQGPKHERDQPRLSLSRKLEITVLAMTLPRDQAEQDAEQGAGGNSKASPHSQPARLAPASVHAPLRAYSEPCSSRNVLATETKWNAMASAKNTNRAVMSCSDSTIR